MWIALKLLASGALNGLLKGFSAALAWLFEDWRNMALAGTGAALGWTLVFTVPGLRADIAARDKAIVRVTIERDAEAAAHLGTVNAFLDATSKAQKDAEANAERVAREQEAITDDITRQYRADLAALRARFDRLRAGAARTAIDPGDADPAGLPGLPDPARRTDEAPGQDRLPAAGELSLPDALIASEQALQLDALIGWIEAQSAVRFTTEVSQ